MFQLSVQNQVRRLQLLLNKNQLLVNNKLVSPSKDYKIPENNARSIVSILNYLNKRGEINKIHPWLDEKDQHILSEAIKNNELNAVNAIFTNMHVKQDPLYSYLTFNPINEFIHEIPLNLENFKNIIAFEKYTDERSTQAFTSEISGRNLYIMQNKDTLAKEDITALIASLKKWSEIKDSTENARIPLSAKVKIISNEQFKKYSVVNDSLIIRQEKYKIYFNSIEMYKQDTFYTVNNMKGILLY